MKYRIPKRLLFSVLCVFGIAGAYVVWQDIVYTQTGNQNQQTQQQTIVQQQQRMRGESFSLQDSVAVRRAQRLYVSNKPEDHSRPNFEAQIRGKARTDSIYTAQFAGIIDFKKITYRSRIGDMDIPAYLFQPIQKRGTKGHAAMVWVHGGVHGDWGTDVLRFVKEAVSQGYVIIAPEYRGSTGYGAEHYLAIDYGGYEIDDVLTAVDYLKKNVPIVDPERIGIMGWSHGGYITLFTVFRDNPEFKCAAAIVPVTNLVFRLSYKGPSYQRDFSTQVRIQGLPFEKPDIYIQRSPYYHVDKLKVPLLVHVATNDQDVNFVECQMLIDALRARKPNLAETKIYENPPGGHSFSRRAENTRELVDSWQRTWAFFEWNLQPGLDTSK
jgi:dipeptidyl aminopeptidase/acylaminoacyl peptidase